jgi:exonuclease SbcD
MIKFIHTADLHLGKALHEHSLIEDQRYMLDQLIEILKDPSYRALLVSGDVYDRSIPPPEAVQLFSTFLGRLKSARQDLEILIIPGNHDSSPRLSYGRELFAELGLHFVTEAADAVNPIWVYPEKSKKAGGESAAFFLLPFLSAGSLNADETGDGGPIRSQAKLAEEAAARLEKARLAALEKGASYTALGAHLFAAGGMESGTERVFLGTAEQVAAGLFSGFDYAGFGHLHRFQKIEPNAVYSGSPLPYSFDEAAHEKVFLSVELGTELKPGLKEDGVGVLLANGNGSVRANPIAVRPLRKMTRLKGSFQYFLTGSVAEKTVIGAAEDYLEITLTGKELALNALSLLRGRFPYLLSVRQEEAFAALSEEHSHTRLESASKKRSALEDFAGFLTDIHGHADPDKLELFKELLLETEKDI